MQMMKIWKQHAADCLKQFDAVIKDLPDDDGKVTATQRQAFIDARAKLEGATVHIWRLLPTKPGATAALSASDLSAAIAASDAGTTVEQQQIDRYRDAAGLPPMPKPEREPVLSKVEGGETVTLTRVNEHRTQQGLAPLKSL